ncbi:MAG: rhodanese-like domain-containing protein [Betaproteobacteria bacterium]|nr:rhodanese-like domain-containing protein [Betaproteobacteria bacterium]
MKLHAPRSCVVFLVAAVCASLPLKAEVIDVNTSELAHLSADGVTIVDVRRVEEWRQTGVISGSKRLTYSDAQGKVDPEWVKKMKAIAPPDRPVALICRTGGRTTAAAKLLDEAGYKKVYNARGGIHAWIDAGLPVVPPESADRKTP